jgi:thiamine-phosphate pyrophosphorylase
VQQVRAAARAGVHLIQLRERDLDARPLLELTTHCVEAVRGTRARVVLNDRVDVALAAGAHGVHLRGDSVPTARVRALTGSGFLIGRSVHTAEEARHESGEGGDYLLFGTVFPSRSKPAAQATGPADLARAVAATTLPVLAIGGITPDRLAAVARAGAAGFGAIDLFAASPDALPAIIEQAVSVFDGTADPGRG